MGGCRQHLLGVLFLALIVTGTVVAGNAGQGLSIRVKRENGRVFLQCKTDRTVLGWSKDGSDIGGANQSELLLGAAADDPRGLYQCRSTEGNASLQLYFRMCQYCIRLNSATVLGIVAASVVATAFLVGAVWCLAAEEPRRHRLSLASAASDKRTLLAHDQLYQPLGERNNGQYSHIGVAKARRR